VPDNLQLMTYLTALCPGVDLGTAAVIVPWHDPRRVAEQAAVLHMLRQGRLRFGGMRYEVAEQGLKLFAKEVRPVLKAQSPAAARRLPQLVDLEWREMLTGTHVRSL
jgi:hypothetical protein